jgi:hypothetical protein
VIDWLNECPLITSETSSGGRRSIGWSKSVPKEREWREVGRESTGLLNAFPKERNLSD